MKLYDNLIFYNLYGNGDIFINREFVKKLIKEFPARKFYFAHAKDPHLLSDIPELGYIQLDNHCDMRLAYNYVGNTIYFNTWIGYAWGKYVEDGATCTLDNYVRMYNDTLTFLGEPIQFGTHYRDYLPTIDYRKLDTTYLNNIEMFIQHTCDSKTEDIVLISNGDVQSGQANNTDFTPYILRLCKEFPTKHFIITQDICIPEDEWADNLNTAAYIIRKESCDLLEISYLSTYCNTIIGRSSGPYVYAQTKENYLDSNKKFLSFTHNPKGGHMAFFDVPARKYWAKDIDYDLMVRVINE